MIAQHVAIEFWLAAGGKCDPVDAVLGDSKILLDRSQKRTVWVQAYTVGRAESIGKYLGSRAVRRNFQEGTMMWHHGRFAVATDLA